MTADYSRFFMSQMPEPASAPATVPQSSPVRLAIGILVGAAVAFLGGLILGEYPFTGFMPYIAGVLFAMVVAEVITSISRRHGLVTALAAAGCTAGGLGLAVRISSGDGLAPIPIGAWIALAIGLVVALVTGGITRGWRKGPSSHPSS